MVRDGYYYALGLAVAAVLLGWLAGWLWALSRIALAVFFLWFFRDPERVDSSSRRRRRLAGGRQSH